MRSVAPFGAGGAFSPVLTELTPEDSLTGGGNRIRTIGPALQKCLLDVVKIGDGGTKSGGTYRFRSQTAMTAWKAPHSRSVRGGTASSNPASSATSQRRTPFGTVSGACRPRSVPSCGALDCGAPRAAVFYVPSCRSSPPALSFCCCACYGLSRNRRDAPRRLDREKRARAGPARPWLRWRSGSG